MKLFKSSSPKNSYYPFIFRETSEKVYSFEGFIFYGFDHYLECSDAINTEEFLVWFKSLNLKKEYDLLMKIFDGKESNLKKLLLFFESVEFIDEKQMDRLKSNINLWEEQPIKTQLKKRGDLSFYNRRYDLALKFYKKAQEREFDPIVEHNIGITYMKLQFFNKAEIALKKALEYLEALEIHLNLLRLYKIANRYDKAFNYANNLRKRYDNWEILYEIGSIYELKGQYENAIKIYLNAYNLDDNGQVLIKIIQVMLKLKEKTIDINLKPIKEYLDALKDKNEVYYFILKAKIMEVEGHLEQAIEILEEGLTISNGDKNIAIELAKLCRNNKRIIQSIQAISKAQSAEVIDEEILFEMALIAKKAGNRKDYSHKLNELISYWKTLVRGSYNY